MSAENSAPGAPRTTMVGTQRTSPLDRMWSNLMSCGVSCQGGRHVLQGGHDADYAYHKRPLPEGADDDVSSGKENGAEDEEKQSQMANTQVREDQSPNINTQRKNCPKKDNEQENRSSKWKRLRQTLKMLGIQKQNSSPKNGKVIKLRNGYKIIVPDIIITAPEEEKDSDRDFTGQEKLDICTSLEE